MREKPYYLLGAGDIYNMRTRQVGRARHGRRLQSRQEWPAHAARRAELLK